MEILDTGTPELLVAANVLYPHGVGYFWLWTPRVRRELCNALEVCQTLVAVSCGVFRVKYFHQDRETLLCSCIPTLTAQFRVCTEGRAGMTKTLV